MTKDMILVLENGDKLPITGEDGKFWICGERKFRKLSQNVAGIMEADTPIAEHEETLAEAIQDVKNVVAKKKPTRKKKQDASQKLKEG